MPVIATDDPFETYRNGWKGDTGRAMISSDCDFQKFVREIRGKDYYDVIYLAEKEVTLAWRHSYHNSSGMCGGEASRKYQEKLIGLIDFMRHGFNPSVLDDQDLQLCSQLVHESVQPQRSVAPDAYVSLV